MSKLLFSDLLSLWKVRALVDEHEKLILILHVRSVGRFGKLSAKNT